jgi:ribosomal protein L40E
MSKKLFYDIETAPIVGTVWGKYEQNLIWTINDWYMLMFAYKWEHEKKTHVVALPDFKLYKKDPTNDLEVVKKLHELFNEADIVVAHNGDQFDQKKSNARFIYHDLEPVAPYQSIDTKKVAKRYFNFTSNKLDDLGTHFKLGNKLHTDYTLWQGCMSGDMKAWKAMKKYNIQDVVLLEKVYQKMMPWMTTHPNIATIDNKPSVCPKCGAENSMQARGYRYTKVARYKCFRCRECRSHVSLRAAEKGQRIQYV